MGTLLRVLCVNESDEEVERLAQAMQRGGYEPSVERVASEPAFEEALERRPWDLILADYTLPEFSALGVLSVLKRKGLDVPLLIVSDRIGERTAVSLIRAGARNLCLKEDLASLSAMIERELSEAAECGNLQREQAKEERARERLTTVFRSGPIPISLGTVEGRLLEVNERYAELFGYAPEEMIGKTIQELNLWAVSAERDTILKRLRDEGAVSNAECAFRRRSGDIRAALVFMKVLGSAADSPMVTMLVDITERRQLEQHLRDAQRMEALGRFAGGVAHDFNNLLTVITAYCELIISRLNRPDPLRGYVTEIKKAGEQASKLTDQLLTFSRKQVVQPKLLDLNAVLADYADLLRRLLGDDIALVVVPGSGVGGVKLDPGQLEQVLVNLAVNAREAMPGGGTLTLETANVVAADIGQGLQIEPSLYVRLLVRDTGMGMDAHTQAHVFDPFFTTKPGQGAGLGLSTVYGIVKQSGGFITVDSLLGQGTTFKLYFPRVTGACLGEEAAVRSCAPSVSETVLVAEDNDMVRGLVCTILESNGYAVVQAQSGEEAVSLCREHSGPMHLLLTDVLLPGMNGRELAMLAQAIRPQIKVLYMSGYADQVALRRDPSDPAPAFVQKPFTPAVLLEKVRAVLDSPR